jgi:hypothetical protein
VFASALCGQFRGTHQFVQEPESLSLHLANKKIYPRRVAAGPAEAGDKTKLDRVVGAVEDDRNCRGGCLGSER